MGSNPLLAEKTKLNVPRRQTKKNINFETLEMEKNKKWFLPKMGVLET